MLANCNWERPLYIATTVSRENYLGLGNYFLLEGLAYRITPFNWKALGLGSNNGSVDPDRMYENMMKFNYGGLDNPDVYLDETNRRMCLSLRRLSVQVAIELFNKGEKEKAYNVLESVSAGISDELLPNDDAYYGSSSEIANIYLALGHKEKAAKILFATTNNYYQLMRWYLSMNDRNLRRCQEQFSDVASYQYSLVFPLLEKCIDKDQYEELAVEFHNMCDEIERRLN